MALHGTCALPRVPRDLCCARLHLAEVAPPPELAPFVRFGWVHHADGQAHRILPDGEMDLMYVVEHRKLLLAGPRDEALRTAFASPVTVVGLRLALGVGPKLFDLEPEAVRNRQVLLRDLGRSGRALAEPVEDAGEPHDALRALFSVMAPHTQRASPPVDAIRAAVQLVGRSRGCIPMRTLRSSVGMGERRFERAFKEAVGLPAKRFSRLVRFQAAVALGRLHPELEWGEIAAELGYADQAHLSRDARALAGLAPSALRSPTGPR